MCSNKKSANNEICATVSDQLKTLIKANLNNSGYDFFKRFTKVCSPVQATQSYCQEFKEGKCQKLINTSQRGVPKKHEGDAQ